MIVKNYKFITDNINDKPNLNALNGNSKNYFFSI